MEKRKARTCSVTVELMDQVRIEHGCNTVRDLFTKLGMPSGITKARADRDCGAYLEAMRTDRLSSYSAPGYVAKALQQHGQKHRRSRRRERLTGPVRRTCDTRGAQVAHA